MEKLSSDQSEPSDRLLEFDLSAELKHGIAVSNLAYAVSQELGLPHEQCYDLAIAGMLHDIGKLKLRSYINGQESNPLVIEELKYVRMHSKLGYEELKDQDYSDFVLESILYHHENYDGSGYRGVNCEVLNLAFNKLTEFPVEIAASNSALKIYPASGQRNRESLRGCTEERLYQQDHHH